MSARSRSRERVCNRNELRLGHRPDYKAINAAIQSARNASELRIFARKQSALFSGMQHAMICIACTRFFPADCEASIVCALAAIAWLRCARGSSGRDAQGAANVFYSLAKLRPDQIIQTTTSIRVNLMISDVGRECVFVMDKFSSQGAANCIWAAATLGLHLQPAIIYPLANACVRLKDLLNAQGAANTMWALATLNITDITIVHPIADRCAALTNSFNAQNAVNCLWAAAIFNIKDMSFIHNITTACISRTHQFTPQGASNCLWAMATLQINDPALIGPLLNVCATMSTVFASQDAANSLWAAATLSFRDNSVTDLLVSAAIARVSNFTLQGTVNCLWSLAILNITDFSIIEIAVAACIAQLQSFRNRDASICLWSLAALDVRVQSLYTAFSSIINVSHLDKVEHAQQILYCNAATKVWLFEDLFHESILSHCRQLTMARTHLPRSSVMQRDVVGVLLQLGLHVDEEVVVLHGLHAIDILLNWNGRAVAIEIDGPTHYSQSFSAHTLVTYASVLTTSTALRNRLLREGGYLVLDIPHFEWEQLHYSMKSNYIEQKLLQFF